MLKNYPKNFWQAPLVLDFQQVLLNEGVDIDNVSYTDTEITLTRETLPLQIKVIATGPPVIGQLVIVAPNPDRNLDVFGKECEAIIGAFNHTWPHVKQIIARDCTIRYLYESTYGHAFKELWEERLGQSEKSLNKLERKILGGGLRLVMAPLEGETDPSQIQIKVESYLKDSKKMFVEAEFKWPQVIPAGSPFNSVELLNKVDKYIENQIVSFITEGQKNDN
jgi:hypothetical protein